MAGRVTVLTPTVNSDTIELGRTVWRKQVLPIGSLDYNGRKLNFTKDYINDLVASFKAKAFDAVPLQLADADNRHTNAVDRTAGEVIGLEAAEDGLYATVSLTDKGSDIVREHPNLGVSVRIVEQLERGTDGAQFPAALQHVLATWDPRINAMRPWEAVECSNETDEVLDLSALSFAPEADTKQETESPVSTGGANKEREVQPVPGLNDEQREALLKLVPLLEEIKGEQPAEEEAKTEEAEPEFTEAEVAAMDTPVEQPEPIAASADNSDALELANARIDALVAADAQKDILLSRMQQERDEERWKADRASLVKDFAIPGDIADIARPLLYGSDHSIDLSNGKKIDAGAIMRNVLHELGRRYAKAMDFGREYGTADADDDMTRRQKDNEAFFAQVATEYPRKGN